MIERERFWTVLARDAVAVEGPDAAKYLQGQVSQDVMAVAVGATAWTFLLQPSGKVDVLARMTRTDDERFVLDTDGGFGDALLARLKRFALRTKVEFVPLAWSAVAVHGPDAWEEARLGDPASLVVPRRWHTLGGADILGEDPAPPTEYEEASPAWHEWARVADGWPAMGAELTTDTIPGESGVVPVTASFTKGCYTGQELVARIDSRGGNVPRHLRRLILPGPDAVAPGEQLEHDGKDVGWVTSVAGPLALGYVGRAVTPPAVVRAASGCEVAVEAINVAEPVPGSGDAPPTVRSAAAAVRRRLQT